MRKIIIISAYKYSYKIEEALQYSNSTAVAAAAGLDSVVHMT